MFRILLRKQLMETFRSNFYDQKTGKKRSKAAVIGLFALFFVLVLGLIGGAMTLTALSMANALVPEGLDWLYFATLSLTALLLGTLGSAFTTYSELYLGKDNDLLISMPIPSGTIVLSRLTAVYLIGLGFSGIVTIPAAIVYWLVAGTNFTRVLCGLDNVLLVSLIVLALSCLLGWVVAKLSSHFKRKSFLTAFVSLLTMSVFMLFGRNAETILQQFILHAAVFGEKIEKSVKPLFIWGKMGTGDLVSTALCLACTAALCLLTWLLLSKTFLKMATATGKTSHAQYREKKVAQKSVAGALTRKEFRRFTSSANYMLNTSLGVVLMVPAAAALFVFGPSLSKLFGLLTLAESKLQLSMLPALLCAVLCMLGSTIFPATPSVALEGKNLWLSHSLPFSAWQSLRAKLNMQLLLLGIPTLLCCAALLITLPFSAEVILTLPLMASFVLFYSMLALAIGLRKPNLSWTNENTVTKQGLNVFLIMIGGWVYAALLGVGCVFAGSSIGTVPFMGAATALNLLIALILYKWLKGRGCKIYAGL